MRDDLQMKHRRSIRLKGYDYSQAGAYFVTICAFRREEIFGTEIDGGIQLSPIGQIIKAEWFHSAEIRKEIRLFEDECVVMPNHLHGIVWIVNENVGANGVRTIDGAKGMPNVQGMHVEKDIHTEQGTRRVPLRMAPRSLASFIAGFKASVTCKVGQKLNAANVWQRNYYEHIIRSENELKNIWNYIDTNPLRWQEDQLHPSATPNPFN